MKYLTIFFLIPGCLLFQSCFTGIESTKKIGVPKDTKHILAASPEANIMNLVKPDTLYNWKPGKKFFVSNPKISFILDNKFLDKAGIDSTALSNTTLIYKGYESRLSADGNQKITLIFNLDDKTLPMPTSYATDWALRNLTSDKIPFLIDLEMIHDSDSVLSGKEIWPRTHLWYDENNNRRFGNKFVAATITKVYPGNNEFPIKIQTRDIDNNIKYYYINSGYSATESRSFDNLFFLSDVKQHYPSVNDDMWDYIKEGKLKIGMTKEECRLSVGNPDDTDSGRDWSQTLDIWRYKNGMFLQFADGLLTSFRL